MKTLEETIENLDFIKNALYHYDQALKIAFPKGASGEVFEHWNEARKYIGYTGAKPILNGENK